MRYENWDVLLFPSDSKIPIQEFNTKFYVLQNSCENLESSHRESNSDGEDKIMEFMNRMPTVTCFVTSLETGTPFRVSIHSWQSPNPSQLLASSKAPNELVLYGAKIYIDGILVAQRALGEKAVWPEVVDTAHGYPNRQSMDVLRFPPFHQSVLGQAHWNAGDSFGRIRVVISEGVLRHSNRSVSQKYSYDRLRDIVWFSFQHAPKNVLTHAAIAWPNPKAFQNALKCVENASDYDAHAHSPQKFQSAACTTPVSSKAGAMMQNVELAGLTGSWTTDRVTANAFVEDPFIEPCTVVQGRTARKFSSDVTMSDFESGTNRSEMSGVATQKTEFHKQINQAAVSEIVSALSPSRKNELLSLLSPRTNCDQNQLIRNDLSRTAVNAGGITHSELPHRVVFGSSTRTSSASGHSCALSWETNAVTHDQWPNNEFPGLLGVMRSSSTRPRSDSSNSKRKRSISPAVSVLQPTNTIVELKSSPVSPVKCQVQNTTVGKKIDLEKCITVD